MSAAFCNVFRCPVFQASGQLHTTCHCPKKNEINLRLNKFIRRHGGKFIKAASSFQLRFIKSALLGKRAIWTLIPMK